MNDRSHITPKIRDRALLIESGWSTDGRKWWHNTLPGIPKRSMADAVIIQRFVDARMRDTAEVAVKTIKARFVTREEMAQMDCPFPPEPGYEDDDG